MTDSVLFSDKDKPLIVWLRELLFEKGTTPKGELIVTKQPWPEELILVAFLQFSKLSLQQGDRTIPLTVPRHHGFETRLRSRFANDTLGVFMEQVENFVPSRFFLFWLVNTWPETRTDVKELEIYKLSPDFLMLLLYHIIHTLEVKKIPKITLLHQKLYSDHVPYLLQLKPDLLTIVSPGFPLETLLDQMPTSQEVAIWDDIDHELKPDYGDLKLTKLFPYDKRDAWMTSHEPTWRIFPIEEKFQKITN